MNIVSLFCINSAIAERLLLSVIVLKINNNCKVTER